MDLCLLYGDGERALTLGLVCMLAEYRLVMLLVLLKPCMVDAGLWTASFRPCHLVPVVVCLCGVCRRQRRGAARVHFSSHTCGWGGSANGGRAAILIRRRVLVPGRCGREAAGVWFHRADVSVGRVRRFQLCTYASRVQVYVWWIGASPYLLARTGSAIMSVVGRGEGMGVVSPEVKVRASNPC
jgi:hypothetical protein